MKITVHESMSKVTEPEHVFRLLKRYFKRIDKIDRDKEHFFVLHIDARNRVKILELVSIGILNASLVHPREVFTRAVAERSAQILIAHNHPSGDTDPSHEDIAMTRRLSEAGRILGIELIDHIIFTHKAFCSLKEQNLL